MPFESLPRLSREQVRTVAEDLYRDYLKAVGDDQVAREGIFFDKLYEEVIYPQFEIRLEEDVDLGVDTRGKRIFGLFDVRGNVAMIDRALKNDPRRTFTRYHEVVGHGVLQAEFLRTNYELATLIFSEDGHQGFLDRIERQANLCASYAAAPPPLIAYSLERVLGISRSRPLDFVSCRSFSLSPFGTRRQYQLETFDELCRILASIIQPRFDGLSVEALSYRIAKLSSTVRDRTPPLTAPYRRVG